MNAIKKIQTDGKKILSVFGLKIPYATHQNGVTKSISIGPVKIPYHFTDKRHIPLPFPQSPKSIRCRGVDELKKEHYREREKWNDSATVKARIEELYERRMGHSPNLEQPMRFTEKLNGLKLTCQDPRITVCCDKYALKGYVDQLLGPMHCVPTLAAWKCAGEIDFDALPNSFVLKVNWSSGYNLFIHDKAALTRREKARIRAQIEVWLRPEGNSYYDSFNWGYKEIAPVVYAEPFLPTTSTVQEYKVFCFHGKPEFTLMEVNPLGGEWSRVCVDNNGTKLPFTFGTQAVSDRYETPEDLRTMLDMAKILAVDFPFVRVDFLGTKGHRMVGEMTFYSGGGFSKITPDEWDEKIGCLL